MNNFITAIKDINIKNVLKRKKVKQVSSLYISMILGIIVGIVVSVVNTRLLGPQQYGDLKFLQNLFSFVVTFLTLGVFTSGSRLIAQRKNEAIAIKNQLIGNLLIFACVISVALIIGLFAFSFVEEEIFHNQLGCIIRIFSPLLFVFPFKLCLENIMQGDNRIYELSVFRLSPSVLYILGALSFNYVVPLSLTSVLAIQLSGLGLIILATTIRFRPTFGNIRKYASIIWNENKAYGFQVYLGIISNVGTAHIAALSIAYFIDNTSVGFYSLAVSMATPLAMISSAVGTTFFKDFANRNSIPKRATLVTLVLSLSALLFFFLIIEKVILMLYSAEYVDVVPLAHIISVGCVLRGLGDYVNRFLGAHGKGRELRNGAFANGISNVFGYVVLVYFFGVKGAAFTRTISDMVYLSMMCYYYRKFRNKMKPL